MAVSQAAADVGRRDVRAKLERGDEILLFDKGPLQTEVHVRQAGRVRIPLRIEKSDRHVDECRQRRRHEHLKVRGEVLIIDRGLRNRRAVTERRARRPEEVGTIGAQVVVGGVDPHPKHVAGNGRVDVPDVRIADLGHGRALRQRNGRLNEQRQHRRIDQPKPEA